MTIVINVQAIRHCHRRTYTAALKDLAISINVPCPSVATSSFPLNNLAVMWYCVSFTYSWTVSQRCPVERGDNGNLQAPFSCIVLLWVNRACVCFVLIVLKKNFFVGNIQDCWRGKTNSKVGYPIHPWGSFPPLWIMETITEDVGLGCACFIKLKVLYRMQNALVQ